MITMYEIHVRTKATLGDLLTKFKTKGLPADLDLCSDGHLKLVVKHPQSNTLHTFNVKLYKEIDGMKEYEFGALTEQEFGYLKELVKDI